LRLTKPVLGRPAASVGLEEDGLVDSLALAGAGQVTGGSRGKRGRRVQAPLGIRLGLMGLATFGATVVVMLPIYAAFAMTFMNSEISSRDADLLVFAGLGIMFGGLLFFVPWITKLTGDILGGQGRYIGAVLGVLGGVAYLFLLGTLLGALPAYLIDISLALMMGGFVLAPAIGYEFTSHFLRRADQGGKPRNFEAGVAPLVDLRGSSGLSFQGATMALRWRF
ncbi:MAG: hypothetical protein ACNA8W_23685, partial [Bradymonadaceae bacterium]